MRLAENQYLVKKALAQLALRNPHPESHRRNRALCSVADPALFDHPAGRDFDRAKSFCDACTVRAQCEQYAVTMDDPGTMIWAGLTPAELKKKRKEAEQKRRQREMARATAGVARS